MTFEDYYLTSSVSRSLSLQNHITNFSLQTQLTKPYHRLISRNDTLASGKDQIIDGNTLSLPQRGGSSTRKVEK